MKKEKTPPPLPGNTPGVNGFRYKQQYGVIVVCAGETEHRQTYERLVALGFKCKAVRV